MRRGLDVSPPGLSFCLSCHLFLPVPPLHSLRHQRFGHWTTWLCALRWRHKLTTAHHVLPHSFGRLHGRCPTSAHHLRRYAGILTAYCPALHTRVDLVLNLGHALLDCRHLFDCGCLFAPVFFLHQVRLPNAHDFLARVPLAE